MKRCLVLSLVLGCASTVGGSGATVAPPTNLDITVLLWPRTPGVPAAAAPARAEAEDGTTVDGVTGPDGHLRLDLDPTKRYAITVAPTGYVPVSLLGVSVPFRTTMRLQPLDTGLRPPDAAVTVRRVTYTGRRAADHRVGVEGGFSDLMERTDESELVVEDWPGAPPLDLSALEYDGPRGALPVNAIRLARVPRRTMGALNLAFPSPPTAPMTGASVLEFPSVGLVTGAMQVGPARAMVFQRKYTATGDRPATVGAARLEPPSERRAARMIVTYFEGPLLPEHVVALFRVAPPDRMGITREVTFTTRPPFAGLALSFPPVEALGVAFDARWGTFGPRIPSTELRLRADTRGWHRATFAVTFRTSLRWEGFAVDGASWRGRPLPSFPPGTGVATFDVGDVQVCVQRDDPTAREPAWSQAPLIDTEAPTSHGRSLVRVCAWGARQRPDG